MKKSIILTLLAISLVSGGASFAQISQGTFLVGASSNLNYSSTSSEGDDYNTFLINLMGGYFVSDNVALGLGVQYTDVDRYSYTSLNVFGRYYLDNKIFFGVGYSTNKIEDSDAFNSIGFKGGYAAFVTDNIAIEPSLGYSIGVGDNESNVFSLNVGFALYFNRTK